MFLKLFKHLLKINTRMNHRIEANLETDWAFVITRDTILINILKPMHCSDIVRCHYNNILVYQQSKW